MTSRDTLNLAFAKAERPPVTLGPCSWRGFRAEHVVLASDEPYEFKTLGHSHYLALHDMRLDDGELHIDGLPPIRRTDLRDTLTYAPRGCAVTGWAKPRQGSNSFTTIYFDPEEAVDGLGQRYEGRNPRPFAYARDAALVATMRKIKDMLSSPHIDSLYAEALCLSAAIEILGVRQKVAAGHLTAQQLARLSDYIDTHLHGPITLDDLAQVAGLSRAHFSRSFKATTGQGPYRFVTARRIHHARQLLSARGGLNVVGISQAVGFANPGVFRRAFHQSTGLTPQQYRKRLL